MLVTRSYKLPVVANRDKRETAEYLLNRFSLYVQYCTGQLFFNGNKSFSTVGCGSLFNQAQHKAKSIIKALRAAEKETGDKTNVPVIKNTSAPCMLEKSKEYLKLVDADLNASKELMNRGRSVILEKILPKFNIKVAGK